MKFLEKKVTLGEKSFKVRINRDIAVKSFEEYPDILEYFIKQNDIKSKLKNGKQNDTDTFITMLKNKQLSALFDTNERIAELVKFALPIMIGEANDDADANEIIEYASENGVIETFNAAMVEFIMQGFTIGELGKAKIEFSMK